MDVIAGAEILGIDLEGLQIGRSKANDVKALDKELSNEPNKLIDVKNEFEKRDSVETNHLELKQETTNDDGANNGFISAIEDPLTSEIQVKELSAGDVKEPTGDKLVCSFCEKELKNRSYLKKHMMIHSSEPQFKCEDCDKLFAQKVNLTRHATKHTGDKKFSCSKCGQKFHRMDNLRRHMTKH